MKQPRPPRLTNAGVLALSAAVLGLLAAFLPVYIRAKDWATDRSTMTDMLMFERAIRRFVEANGRPPANPNGLVQYNKPFFRDLLPYLDFVRPVDWWGYNYWIWTGPGNRAYGLTTDKDTDTIIVSTARRGGRETWVYDPARPEGGLYEIRSAGDFEKDIVLWNGRFIRAPKK